jgi:hypothetical protein
MIGQPDMHFVTLLQEVGKAHPNRPTVLYGITFEELKEILPQGATWLRILDAVDSPFKGAKKVRRTEARLSISTSTPMGKIRLDGFFRLINDV